MYRANADIESRLKEKREKLVKVRAKIYMIILNEKSLQ